MDAATSLSPKVRCQYALSPSHRTARALLLETTACVATDQGNIYVWQMQNGAYDDNDDFVVDTENNELTDLRPVTTFRAHDTYITRCAMSPDARCVVMLTSCLATCSADTTVKLWSTTNYRFAFDKALLGHQRWVWDVAFSADSAYLVTASSDHVARLWELATGETVRQYNGHHRAIVSVALNDTSLGSA